jgi:protein-disulfide isomerase
MMARGGMKWAAVLAAGALSAGTVHSQAPAVEEPAKVLDGLDLQNLPMQGDPAADVVLVEFADFDCPYCRIYAGTTRIQINDEYVRTGKIRYVFVNFPLAEHSGALQLAAAGECARRQGKFWPLHDELFVHLEPRAHRRLQHAVANVGIDAVSFADCVKDPQVRSIVQHGLRLGERLGVQGTPWFFIGRVNENHWTDVTHVFGARPLENFRSILEPLLAPTQQPRESPRPGTELR